MASYSRDWTRELKERIAQIDDWHDRGLCMACGEEMATRRVPGSGGIPGIDLCTLCETIFDVNGETIAIPDPHINQPLRVPMV